MNLGIFYCSLDLFGFVPKKLKQFLGRFPHQNIQGAQDKIECLLDLNQRLNYTKVSEFSEIQ